MNPAMASVTAKSAGFQRRRLLLAAPLAVAGVAIFGWETMLSRMSRGTFDPRSLTSPLVGHQVPSFNLPGLEGPGFAGADLAALHSPILINYFASWCTPCIEEMQSLGRLAKAGVRIWGISYKDAPDPTKAFLARNGNPYGRIAMDEAGRTAIDWGVYGVPETYFIDAGGIVRWRCAGALSDQIIDSILTRGLRASG